MPMSTAIFRSDAARRISATDVAKNKSFGWMRTLSRTRSICCMARLTASGPVTSPGIQIEKNTASRPPSRIRGMSMLPFSLRRPISNPFEEHPLSRVGVRVDDDGAFVEPTRPGGEFVNLTGLRGNDNRRRCNQNQHRQQQPDRTRAHPEYDHASYLPASSPCKRRALRCRESCARAIIDHPARRRRQTRFDDLAWAGGTGFQHRGLEARQAEGGHAKNDPNEQTLQPRHITRESSEAIPHSSPKRRRDA